MNQKQTMKKSMSIAVTIIAMVVLIVSKPIMTTFAHINQTAKNGISSLLTNQKQLSTASNATAANAVSLFSTNLWLDISMSENLTGEGTEQSPYLINSMDDLRYLAYHVANDELMDGYSGNYFELTGDLMKESDEEWLPIGYFQNNNDAKPRAFKAVFNGNGYRISNLIIDDDKQVYAGLFGYIQDAEIYNLIVAGTVSAKDKAALVAGVADNSKIEACISEGMVTAVGTMGGIVGEAYHSAFKNCFNTAAMIGKSSEERTAYAGGIAGVLHDSIITNCTSITATNDNKLYSDDVAGGIAGYVEDSGIYNCYVEGLIGNADTDCLGGIVGRLQSGEVRVNRFAGMIANDGEQSGLFIGDIVSSGLVLGKQISHLYVAGQEQFTGNAFGNRLNSKINATHNIGAYQENETKFAVLNQGTFYTQAFHFYMALESGVLAVNNEYLHHWAPDFDGRPIIGYLIRVPSVESGTLSVKEASNRYAHSIDSENPRAIASGRTVVVTALLDLPEHSLAERSLEYVTRNGETEAIIGDSFIMPEANIDVQVHYKTAVQDIELNQSALEFTIEMIRFGNRNNPQVEYQVTASQQLIATISPENADDKTVRWFVKDSNHQADSDILFVEDGIVQVNLKAAKIQHLITMVEAMQIEAPDKAIYLNEQITVWVTALANDNKHVDCEVTIDFFVTDKTKNSLNDISLSHEVIEFQIVTTLVGNRLSPEVLISEISEEYYQLEVMIHPENAKIDKLHWSSNQSMITVTAKGLVYFNNQSLWIHDNIEAVKNRNDTEDQYRPFLDDEGNDLKYEVDGVVMVTAFDEIGNVVTRACNVKVVHKIIDETEVFVEDIRIDNQNIDIMIERRLTGSRINPVIEYVMLSTDDKVTDTLTLADNHQLLSGTLNAAIVPTLATNQDYFWQSTNIDVIDINQDGQYIVRTDADWIKEIIIADSVDAEQERYQIKTAKGTISAEIIAITVAKGIEARAYSATTIVNISFKTVDQTNIYAEELILDSNELVFNVLGIKAGNIVTFNITDAAGNSLDTEYYQKLTAIVSPLQTSLATVILDSANPDLIFVENDGTIGINLESQWLLERISNQDTMAADKVIVTVITAETDENGQQLRADVEVIINFAMTDNSEKPFFDSSASSDNRFTDENLSLTDWDNDRNGWIWSDKVYSNWKNIKDKWYYFNFNGYLLTGWQDIGGRRYYFDIPNGYMAIGWNYIDGQWFYFDSKGALIEIETMFEPSTIVVTEGSWEAFLSGWRFKNSDEKLIISVWKLIGGVWYYFDENGFIVTGKHDIDGKTYIFETINGCLVYGWIQLDGVWYYGGVDGALLKNTISPDGYRLDEDGKWLH